MQSMNRKRILSVIGLLGLVLLLGACRITAEITRPVSQPALSTSWELVNEGRYVICENFDTRVWFSALAADPRNISQVRVQVRGENTDEFDFDRTISARNLQFDANGRFTAELLLRPGQAPLAALDAADPSLRSSAIVIVPDPNDPAAQSGTTLVRFTVDTNAGASYSFGYYDIPVWGGCETQ